MKGLKTTKRLIAAVLSLVMMLGMLPVIPLSINAVGTDGTSNFVSLPITIRDYASDGMLFECNELGKYDLSTYGGGVANSTVSTPTIYGVNPNSWGGNNYMGIRVAKYEYTKWSAASRDWHCIICNASGDIVKVIPSGTLKGTSSSGAYFSAMKSGYYAIWVFSGDSTNYSKLSFITESNKSEYAITYTTSNITISRKVTKDGYNLGNTLGYGLLATNGNAWLNDLPADGGIAGTTLIENGTWNGQTAPTVMTHTLSSGATQILHGAYIRTDLVADKLAYDANGKPQLVYTEATVNYLANYMAKTLAQPQKTNGNYNMWYVMGYKHESLGGKDLATVLREKATGGLGSYAETVKKASELTGPDALNYISTFTDAAYFLLHNLYNDQTGYGKTVDQYTTLNLVQKTANGKTYYTFNSAYDNVVYGTDGVIKNSQTSTITQRKSYDCPSYNSTSYTEADWYVRGNIQPFYSFNPVGNYGYGYAASRDTYRDFCEMYQINKDNTSQNEYYDKVNFHYTLEGHAEFIYHADDELYFIFTGDDDVYLYINGVRVLDAGGAHAISRVEVNLNDVAEMCGLHDGEIYKFDFYYMERHGSSANFGIETNIKIVDPAMVTEKRAWQNDNLVGYNGYVLPDVDIVYDFSITNNGETSIGDLTFLDETLGVSLSKDAIVLPNGTSIKDIAAYHFAADGSVKAFTNPADMNKDILKSYLAAETPETKLQVGEKLLVYGFKHKLGNNDADVFDNYVYTTAVADGENVDDAKRNLNGMDNHRVQKTHYAFESLEFYDGGHLDGVNYGQLDENKSQGVTITRDELLAPMKAKEDLKNLNYSKATIALTNASGTSTSVKYNATIQADGSIFFQTGKVGTELFYYAVTVGDYTYEPIAVHVHTYGVDDSIFVLDYNLPVELFENTAHITRNDILTLNSNVGTSYSINTSASKVGTYGDFTAADGSLIYTMKQFLNGLDSIEVEVTVLKNGATAVDKTTGVVLTQTVSVAPANVMYYEDDFTGEGAITYVNTGSDVSGNIWAVFETEVTGDQQSADQEMNYGSDPNYTVNKGEYFRSLNIAYLEGFDDKALLDAVNADIFATIWGGPADGEIPGLDGDASNGTLHAMAINIANAAELMSFEFTGTGFEIVGRTTTYAYAVLTIVIEDKNTGTMTAFPVITECVNGDLSQIPFAARKNLAYSDYKVTVLGSNAKGLDRMVYVDGVRVYQPLDEDVAASIYKANETVAEFYEIKDLIYAGNMVYGDIAPDADDGANFTWGIGNTMIENFRPDDDISGNYTLTNCDPDDLDSAFNDYIKYGPNNEIYLSNANGAALSYIAFYVVLDENYVGERSIQVGAHFKPTRDGEIARPEPPVNDDPEAMPEPYDPYGVRLVYGNSVADFTNATNAVNIETGTEQYYTIDVVWDPVNNNNVDQTLVIIGTDDLYGDVLSLTNIKLNGYKIATQTSAEMIAVQDMYEINACTLMSRVVAIGKALANKD